MITKLMRSTNEPTMPSELPKVRIDYNGLLDYAKQKGVGAAELSDDEKSMFITPDEKA